MLADPVTDDEWIWPDAPKTQQEEVLSAEDETEGAEMAKIESWFDCDLKRPVQVQVLSGNVFSLDNNGSRIGVKFYDNGQKTTVTGSVSGRFILANGQTIDAITGTLATVNGQSVAYLDVPQSVLHVPGPLKITIQLTDSSVVTTVAAILATVYQTKTDDEIVPSQQVIDDWNAAITQAIGTQNLAIANQDAKIDDLKSALENSIPSYTSENGYITPEGNFSENSGFKTTSYIEAIGCIYITGRFISLGSQYNHVNCYDENKNFLEGLVPGTGDTATDYVNEKIVLPDNARFIRVTTTAATFTLLKVILRAVSENTLEDRIDVLFGDSFKAVDVGAVLENQFPEYTSENGYINGSGNFVSFNGFKTTDYIEASDHVLISGRFVSLDSSLKHINCYDENRTFLSGFLSGTGTSAVVYNNEEFALPIKTRYIRVTMASDRYTTLKVRFKATTECDIYKKEKPVFAALNNQFPAYTSENGYINTIGSFAENGGFKTTSYIEATGCMFITGRFLSLGTQYYHINCYDENKSFLEGLVHGTDSSALVYTNEKIVLPTNTRFVRITTAAADFSLLQVILRAVSDNALEDRLDILFGENIKANDVATILVNQCPTYTSDNGYIKADGTFAAFSAFKTTDYLKASNHVVISGKFISLDSSLKQINCYDDNKTFLSGLFSGTGSSAVVYSDEEFTLPTDTRYIRVTTAASDHDLLKIKFKATNEYDVHTLIDETMYTEKYYGLLGFAAFDEFVSIGDSLSCGWHTLSSGQDVTDDKPHSWPAYIEKATGTMAYWGGKTGTTLKQWLEATDWGLPYCQSIGAKPLYFISMGANEHEQTVGTINDINDDNPTTLYGYVGKTIRELRTISPKSIIVCTGDSRIHSDRSVDTVYRNVCNEFTKCFYLDCFEEFRSNIFAPYYNNYHYTPIGYCIMANMFNYKLKQLMKDNRSAFFYINEL